MTGGAASTFSIDQSSAEIRFVTALDYETTTSYVIVVVATDGGGSVVRKFAINMYGIVKGKYLFFSRSETHALSSYGRNVGVAFVLGWTISDVTLSGYRVTNCR